MPTSKRPNRCHVKPMPSLLLPDGDKHTNSPNHDYGLLRRSKVTEKPWGYEELWALTDDYAAKILFVRRGEILSLQYHSKKEETMRVLRGEMLLHIDIEGIMRTYHMREADCIHIAPKTVHRVHAVTDCFIVEASSIQLEDVVRLDDKYGRKLD